MRWSSTPAIFRARRSCDSLRLLWFCSARIVRSHSPLMGTKLLLTRIRESVDIFVQDSTSLLRSIIADFILGDLIDFAQAGFGKGLAVGGANTGDSIHPILLQMPP